MIVKKITRSELGNGHPTIIRGVSVYLVVLRFSRPPFSRSHSHLAEHRRKSSVKCVVLWMSGSGKSCKQQYWNYKAHSGHKRCDQAMHSIENAILEFIHTTVLKMVTQYVLLPSGIILIRLT